MVYKFNKFLNVAYKNFIENFGHAHEQIVYHFVVAVVSFFNLDIRVIPAQYNKFGNIPSLFILQTKILALP